MSDLTRQYERRHDRPAHLTDSPVMHRSVNRMYSFIPLRPLSHTHVLSDMIVTNFTVATQLRIRSSSTRMHSVIAHGGSIDIYKTKVRLDECLLSTANSDDLCVACTSFSCLNSYLHGCHCGLLHVLYLPCAASRGLLSLAVMI